jgi:hypothetical protein
VANGVIRGEDLQEMAIEFFGRNGDQPARA